MIEIGSIIKFQVSTPLSYTRNEMITGIFIGTNIGRTSSIADLIFVFDLLNGCGRAIDLSQVVKKSMRYELEY